MKFCNLEMAASTQGQEERQNGREQPGAAKVASSVGPEVDETTRQDPGLNGATGPCTEPAPMNPGPFYPHSLFTFSVFSRSTS